MKITNNLFLSFGVLLFSLFFYSCRCGSCEKKNDIEIPFNILDKANNIVISKTGKTFFDKYITPDFSKSALVNSNYLIAYRMMMPEKSYVDVKFNITIDSSGNLIQNQNLEGIPDYLKNPNNYNYEVDELKARNIAIKNGLPKGIEEWKAGFIWSIKYKNYVWHIISTLDKNDLAGTQKMNGVEVIIDAVSGNVLETNKWNLN